ncbi:hypothetical protein WP8S17E03_19040 [Aeromonas caviae]|nr:hypothetical protein WP8S17E03_19040 [Aeromonas caviae]
MDAMPPMDDLPSMLSYILLWIFIIPGTLLALACLIVNIVSSNSALLSLTSRCSGSSGRKTKQPPSP